MRKTDQNGNSMREERLQVMLTDRELKALDDFRFKRRMPSRAAAIREILRRGLAADGFDIGARRRPLEAVRRDVGRQRQRRLGRVLINGVLGQCHSRHCPLMTPEQSFVALRLPAAG